MMGTTSEQPPPPGDQGAGSDLCRFCGQARSRAKHRVPGPAGPICADCIEAGLHVVAHGEPGPGHEESSLVLRGSGTDTACEFCERSHRYTFLGRRKGLTRVVFPVNGAVICHDCLDRSGDLLNRAIRG